MQALVLVQLFLVDDVLYAKSVHALYYNHTMQSYQREKLKKTS
jgi:hypothetical protein